MMRFKFNQNHTINEEFDFWGVKEVVLGGLRVAEVGKSWEHVPKHHKRHFLTHCTSFMSRWPPLIGEGGGGLHILNCNRARKEGTKLPCKSKLSICKLITKKFRIYSVDKMEYSGSLFIFRTGESNSIQTNRQQNSKQNLHQIKAKVEASSNKSSSVSQSRMKMHWHLRVLTHFKLLFCISLSKYMQGRS